MILHLHALHIYALSRHASLTSKKRLQAVIWALSEDQINSVVQSISQGHIISHGGQFDTNVDKC